MPGEGKAVIVISVLHSTRWYCHVLAKVRQL